MEIIYKSLNKEAKLRALFDSVGILPSLLQTPDAHTAHRGRAGFGLVLKAKGDDLKPLLHAAHRAAMFTAGSQLLTPSSSCSFPSASHEALTAAAWAGRRRRESWKLQTPPAETPTGAHRFPAALRPAADSSKGKLKINSPKARPAPRCQAPQRAAPAPPPGTARLRGAGRAGGRPGAGRRVTATGIPHGSITTDHLRGPLPSRGRRPRGGRRRGRGAEGSPGQPGPDPGPSASARDGAGGGGRGGSRAPPPSHYLAPRHLPD